MAQPTFRAETSGRLHWPGGEARCVFGRSGVVQAEAKREGDGATPVGVWSLRETFFRPDRLSPPSTRLRVRPLSPALGWCDDAADAAYNRLIQLPASVRHEQLWRTDGLYDLIVVLGYNDAPVRPGRGSAIFLHVASPDFGPTEGCVATTLPALAAMLGHAQPGDALAVAPGGPSIWG